MNPWVLVLRAALLGAIALVGCGGGDSRPVAATVGDATIDHAEVVAYLHGTLGDQGKSPRAYDPPAYRGCVAEKRSQGATDGKHQCIVEYGIMRAQALRALVRRDWLGREAERRGVHVGDASVDRALADRRKLFALGDAPGSYARYLRRMSLSEGELRRRLRETVLEQRITATTAVPPAAVARYYRGNLNEFGHPPRRRVRIAQAHTAQAARSVLASGGGSDSVLIKGFVAEPALARAVFATPVGRTGGPLKTPSGWYAYRVEAATPATRRSLAQATPAIERLLRARVLDRQLYERYGDITTCAARYRVPEVPECLERKP